MLTIVGVGTANFEHHAVVARQHGRVVALAAYADVLEPGRVRVVTSVQTVGYGTVAQNGCRLTRETVGDGGAGSTAGQRVGVSVAPLHLSATVGIAADGTRSGGRQRGLHNQAASDDAAAFHIGRNASRHTYLLVFRTMLIIRYTASFDEAVGDDSIACDTSGDSPRTTIPFQVLDRGILHAEAIHCTSDDTEHTGIGIRLYLAVADGVSATVVIAIECAALNVANRCPLHRP